MYTPLNALEWGHDGYGTGSPGWCETRQMGWSKLKFWAHTSTMWVGGAQHRYVEIRLLDMDQEGDKEKSKAYPLTKNYTLLSNFLLSKSATPTLAKLYNNK